MNCNDILLIEGFEELEQSMQNSKKLVLVVLTTLTTCTLASESNRHTTRSIHHETRVQTSDYEPQRLSTILNNEFTIEPERKVSRLMGGHMKVTQAPTTEKQQVDEANWDDGLFLSSAGNGKEKKSHDDDDEKKTLAQQVREGKYGLIQNEIYPKKPKRPGIISYLSNPEVPKDSAKNLGGLDEDEIWLAENHVLVLRGGNFPEEESEQPTGDLQGWAPIDDYEAPKRQVKIPTKPKVPPPFPVQLTEGGPVEVIGSNDTSSDKPHWFDGLIPANETFLPPGMNNSTDGDNDKKIKNGLGGIVGPFFPSLPPGAVFLPPPGNQSDYDEDDQSIYYPPPYSFKYSQENATAVPPGPLVPGIILPPPPDFFSRLDDRKTTKSHITKYPKRTSTTPKSPTYYSTRKNTTKPYKVISSSTVSIVKEPRPFTMKPLNKFKHKNVTRQEIVTKPPNRSTSYIEVTTSSPNEVSTLEVSEINTVRPVFTNQVIETNTEDHRSTWNELPSKSAPIVAYYASTPPPTVDDPVDTTPVSVKTKKSQTAVPSSASYYFYEETNDDVSGTTPTPSIYFRETTPVYKSEEPTKKPYYNVDVTPSQQTEEDYSSVEVIEPIAKTSPRYQYSDPSPATNVPLSSRSQGQRMLPATSPVFYQTVTDRPHSNLHSYFTAPTSERYTHPTKSKPVYQYSFEAADYSSQRGRQKQLYEQEAQEQPQKQVTFNEWQEEIEEVGQQYSDYDTEVVPEQRLQPERNQYRTRQQQISFPPTTVRPTVVVTTPSSHHAYYTKQDEKFLDDVTREYFTNFGRKIKHGRFSSTTPIYGKTSSVTERPDYSTANSFVPNSFNDRRKPTYTSSPKVKVHYGDQTQRPFSLEGDTNVNYQRPLPAINPDAEFLPGYTPKEGEHVIQRYRTGKPSRHQYVPVDGYREQQVVRQPPSPTSFVSLDDTRENGQRIFPGRPISLSGDIAVNYRDPRPAINPDAEYIDPAIGQPGNHEKSSSYFAYRLPGDSGHFYFLTPHAITQRQDGNSYLYSGRLRGRPRGSRLPRRSGPENV